MEGGTMGSRAFPLKQAVFREEFDLGCEIAC